VRRAARDDAAQTGSSRQKTRNAEEDAGPLNREFVREMEGESRRQGEGKRIEKNKADGGEKGEKRMERKRKRKRKTERGSRRQKQRRWRERGWSKRERARESMPHLQTPTFQPEQKA
jgi:hypothetical protein